MLGGGKFEVSYANNGECSSICDAICDRSEVTPGVVPWGKARGPRRGQGQEVDMVILLFYELGGGKLEVSYAYNGECSSI